MRFRLALVAVSLLSALLASAATVPQYVNSTRVQSPPDTAPLIDAVTFINEGYFEINDFSVNPLPYETVNTLNVKNTASGIMLGHPGYFFENVSGNTRGPLSTFENRGSISSYSSISNLFVANTAANWLLVDSDSIVSSGSLNASESGLIRLNGAFVNLARGHIRAGAPFQSRFFSGAFYLYETNYFHDDGISDVYWGAGTNNTMGGSGSDMVLNGFVPNFSLDNIRSAFHSIAQRSTFGGTLFTNNSNVIPSPSKGVISATYVNTVGTEMFVQTVFVATNFFDTNLTTEITFVTNSFFGFGGFGGPAIAQVGFKSVDHDIALDLDVTNALYVIDGLAGSTNVTLARNFQVPGNRKPDTYAVSKGPLDDFFVSRGNASYTNFPPYLTTYGTNIVPVTYAAYSAQLSVQNFAGDPTNFPGRVEIVGQDVNLRESRIRAESTVSITANNLITNNLARVSAPYLNFDLGTAQPQLLVSNLAPSVVNRLFGTVSAWSAVWNNTDTRYPGMNIHFHVMIVDHDLQSSVPVTVNKFLARAPRIVFNDYLSVNQRLRLDATSVHIKTNGGWNFPPNWSWGSSNMQNIVSFTNEGTVIVPGQAVLGTDRGYAYTDLVNKGSLSAQLFSISGDYFENWGSIAAQSGAFRFDGRKVCLSGQPFVRDIIVTPFIFFGPPLITNYFTNVITTGASTITTRGDLTINANSIQISNCVLQAGSGGVPGAIIITPGIRLTDSGPGYTNYWLATGGIRVMQRPTSLSDLMGTYATVTAPQGVSVQSVWTAADVGAIAAGYSNNLALAKLTLDGGEDSVIRIAGLVDKKKAMYVDYLELLNNATNFDKPDPAELGLVIDPTMVLYFANANFDAAKLDGKQGGRIRWVKGFLGPLSTTNIVYPSGTVYPVNIQLARHKDYDSDGDGIPNAKDPTPVFSPESLKLTIGKDVQPNRVLLSWQALANSTSYVEYKSPIASPGAWQLLRSTTAPVNMRMSMSDIATGGGRTQRIYRVRMDLPPQ